MCDRDMACFAITFAYGHAAVAGVLRGGRAEVVLAGGRAARRDAAGGQPAGARAREAARDAAARPLRPPRRADRGRPPALPRRAAAARSSRSEIVDELADEATGELAGTFEIGASTGPGGVVLAQLLCEFARAAPAAARRAQRLRHADGRRARRRPHARARRRRRRAAPPRRRVRAVLPRHRDPRLPAGPPRSPAARSRSTS